MSPETRVLRQLVEALAFERLLTPAPGGWRVGGLHIRAPHRIGGFGRVRLLGDPDVTLADLLLALAAEGHDTAAMTNSLARTAHFLRAAGPVRPNRLLLRGADLESALIEGHPYHPCFKSRLGFTDADNAAFGPEGGASFPLVWLKADPALIRATGTAFGLPVHPWQWRQLSLDPVVAGWIASGRITATTGGEYRATQSLRTVAPAQGDHVKLSLGVGITSSVRDIADWSVLVAPAVSDWLAGVVASDAGIPITVLREHGAVIAPALGGRLAAILREAPPEDAIPLNALSMTEADGTPLIAPWLARHGTERWLAQYLRVVVAPVWRLLTRHGIGIEAHGQNLLIQHEDGWPTRLIARDFHESLEYVPSALSRPAPDLAAIDPRFAAAPDGEYHRMAQVSDIRELVLDCLFVHVLSELADLLHRRGILPESRFWQAVRAALTDPPTEAVVPAERLAARVLRAPGTPCHPAPNPIAKADPVPQFKIDDRLVDPAALTLPDLLAGRDPARTRVALHMTDKAEYLAQVLRLRAAGASCYPIHPETPRDQALDLARRAGCTLFNAEPIGPDSEGPGVLIQMSSGTTGAPKVIARTWAEIETEVNAYIRHFPNDFTPVIAAPVTHSYGLIAGVMVGLGRGRVPVVLDSANPKTILRQLAAVDNPLLYAAPTLLHVLARLAGAGGLPAHVMTSGTVLPQPWFDTIKGAAQGVFQQYGCSEKGCVALTDTPACPEDMGAPLPHVRVLAGTDAPGPVTIDGIPTGDLGTIDARGHLIFAGRAAEVIDVAGINVYPAEIERVAMTAPGITDAVAFALPDPVSNQRPALAFTGTATPEDLDAFLAANLSPRQRPVRLIPMPALPRGPGGKVSRRMLTEGATA
ncbi:IucA/IucC family protein [Cereibacter sp. SYSU M97828]|nr:IucA/IucC family protein [Cereibacter flavus]